LQEISDPLMRRQQTVVCVAKYSLSFFWSTAIAL
jgi:hypothetical protein